MPGKQYREKLAGETLTALIPGLGTMWLFFSSALTGPPFGSRMLYPTSPKRVTGGARFFFLLGIPYSANEIFPFPEKREAWAKCVRGRLEFPKRRRALPGNRVEKGNSYAYSVATPPAIEPITCPFTMVAPSAKGNILNSHAFFGKTYQHDN